MMDFIYSLFHILLFIIGFGLLIFVHELGHFLAAKWAGIRTEAFAIGFGPHVVSWRRGVGFAFGSTTNLVREKAGRDARDLSDRELAEAGIGETEYSVRWLPLGGFVRMLGQDDMAPAATSREDRSFNRAPIWKRMIVVSAGVTMNLIFAAFLFIIAFSIGVRFEAPVIGMVAPGSPAQMAVGTGDAKGLIGLEPDDVIVSMNGDLVPTFLDATIDVAMASPGKPLEIEVTRHGHDGPLTFEITPVKSEITGVLSIGIAPASSTRLAGGDDKEFREVVESILKRDKLWSAGLRPGMEVVEVDGQPVASLGQFQSLMSQGNGQPISTRWQDDGGSVEITMQPEPRWPIFQTAGTGEVDEGLLGLVPLVQIVAVTPGSPNDGLLQAGDVVMSFGNTQAPRLAEFRKVIADHGAGAIDMAVLRDGQIVSVQPRIVEEGFLKPKPMLGVMPGHAWDTPRVAQPVREIECDLENKGLMQPVPTPVAEAGIMGGSRILSLDSVPIGSWKDLFDGIASRVGTRVTLEFENPTPGHEVRSIQVDLADDACNLLADLGYQSTLSAGLFDPVYTVRSSGGNPFTAISMGVGETVNFIVQTYLTLDRLIRGSVGVEQLQGPVGIVHLGTRIVDRGFTFLLFFLALISVNLAVVNFLPLPIVDGGLFLNLIYEKLKGRPPSPAFQNAAAIVGLLLIGSIFVLVTYNDLVRIVG